MKYKFFVFCPNDPEVINKIVEAASEAGAGRIGHYSRCAFLTHGEGNFKPEGGSKPTIGKVGQASRIREVKIEMECPAEKAREVAAAVRKIHPYEEVVIDFVALAEF